MSDLLVDPCSSHRSNFTNFFLSLQISWNTKLDVHSQNLLTSGNSSPSVKARLKRMERTFATGSRSRFPFSFPRYSSMSSLRPTSPPSWRSSRLPCSERGHNTENEGNQFAIYKFKKSAVVWAHKYYHNTILELKGATLSLIEACYRRTLNVPHPEQPFYASMLPGCAAQFCLWSKPEGELAWGCLLLQFFYLARAGELWDTGGQAEYAMPAFNLESQSRSDHRIQ